MALSDAFCYFDDVQYLKKDWNNRNRIKTSNGAIWLTVPVLTKGYREKAIREIEINNAINWREKHWKAIYLSYAKAPFFSEYSDFFEDVYKKDWIYLTDLNEYMLKYFLQLLQIDIKYYKASELDFRGEKSALVQDMCKKLKASLYIFGSLGRDYADVDSFNKEGIEVYFQDYHHPNYPQLWGDFISHLSVIDLIFNVGHDRTMEVIMSGNITREQLNERFSL